MTVKILVHRRHLKACSPCRSKTWKPSGQRSHLPSWAGAEEEEEEEGKGEEKENDDEEDGGRSNERERRE